MVDDEAKPFYQSITGLFEPNKPAPVKEPIKAKPLPQQQDPEKWQKQANDYFKGNAVQKRVIDIEDGEEVYNKKLVGFLIGFAIFSVIAILVIGGIFVYKYKPTDIDQPINIDPPEVNVGGDNISVDATTDIYPQFNNTANIVIEKVEVICNAGGCNGNSSS